MAGLRQPVWLKPEEVPALPESWRALSTEEACIQLKPGKLFDSKTVSESGRIPVLNQSETGLLGYHDEECGVVATPVSPVVTFANHTCAMRLMKESFSTIQNIFPKVGKPGVTDTVYFYYASLGRIGLSDYKGHHPLFRQTLIPVPPLPVQRRIAGILSAYDELIEKNQRRIHILETMARALYREWFVEFRFPGHDKIPRVASPLGDIPQGWEVKVVKEILARRTGGTVYREADVQPEGATPVIDQSTNELFGFHDNEPDHLASLVKPLAIFGDHTCKMQLLVEPFSVGPNVVPFAAIDDLPTAYVFHVVSSLIHTQEYKRHWIPLSFKEVMVADHATALRFALFISPMLAIQETLRKSIRNLRQTRDLLLPRLLSGQVALTDTAA